MRACKGSCIIQPVAHHQHQLAAVRHLAHQIGFVLRSDTGMNSINPQRRGQCSSARVCVACNHSHS